MGGYKIIVLKILTFNDDGLVINGGDYGDATGTVMAVSPDAE